MALDPNWILNYAMGPLRFEAVPSFYPHKLNYTGLSKQLQEVHMAISIQAEAPPEAPRPQPERVTLSQIYASMFSVFPEGEREKMKEAILYIEETAIAMGGKPYQWDIGQVFAHPVQGERLTLLSSKQAINRRIYERIEQEKRGIPESLTGREKDLLAIATAEDESIREAQRDVQRRLWEENQRYALAKYRDFEMFLQSAWSAKKKLDVLTGKKDRTLSQEIQHLLGSGFWELVDAQNHGYVFFETKQPIFLTYRNRSAGINLRVGMGYYLARYGFKNASLTVQSSKNNVVVSNAYIHPYVSPEGRICWGNAQSAAIKALSEGSLCRAMDLLETLLSNYCPTSTPYASLEQFQAKYNETHPATAMTIDEETIEEEFEEDEDIAF